MSRSRLRFIIFFITAVLILTVQLRLSSSIQFNQYRQEKVRQEQLRQQLWRLQVELETLTQPYQIKKQTPQGNP